MSDGAETSDVGDNAAERQCQKGKRQRFSSARVGVGEGVSAWAKALGREVRSPAPW